MKEKVATALGRIDKAVEEFNPCAVIGLFSGGHDSLSACYVASLHPKFTAVAHINTGIGIQRTRQFVYDTAVERGWNLLEYKATENTYADGTPNPMVYEDIVMKEGFPGAFAHRFMYVKLKERQLRRLERDLGATPKAPVLYVSGARSQESERRMGNTNEIQAEGRRVWVAVIHDWSKLDTTDLLAYAGLRRNPIVDLIHKSGECLCGAFAKRGELEELNVWPETREAYNRIRALELKASEKFPWNWEDNGPPDWWKEKNSGQSFLLDYDNQAPLHLCWSCEKTECKHEWDISSPIDTVEICRKCGKRQSCEPTFPRPARPVFK